MSLTRFISKFLAWFIATPSKKFISFESYVLLFSFGVTTAMSMLKDTLRVHWNELIFVKDSLVSFCQVFLVIANGSSQRAVGKVKKYRPN